MTSGSWCIRRATHADLAAILDIEKSCSTVTWSAGAFQGELMQESNINFVAEVQDGNLAGFLFAMVAADEAHINTVAVAPLYRRQGIATRLIKTLAQKALGRGVGTLYLEVRSRNSQAMSLYTKLGFDVRWIRKKYYANTEEDAVVMSKSLPLE